MIRITRLLIHLLAVLTVPGIGVARADHAELRSIPEVFVPAPTKTQRLADARQTARPWAGVSHRIELPALLSKELEPLQRHNAGKYPSRTMQVGVARTPDGSPSNLANSLIWEALPDGGHAARIEVVSPGASSLRFSLSFSSAPPGIQLWFYGKAADTAWKTPASVAELLYLGEYWSPVISGDSITLELRLPVDARSEDLNFSVRQISHLIYEPTTGQWQKLGAETKASSCETDVVCTQPDTSVRAVASSVARMLFTKSDGTYLCSGTLLADMDPGTQIPYFLTANHCISDQAVARTLNTYWFYESAVCGSDATPNLQQLIAGATMVATDSAIDYTLLRLNENPPTGVTLAGFDANPVAPTLSAIGIHHPKGALKKLSSGVIVGFDTFNGQGSFLDIAWNNGVTESGSSGSGLFTLSDSTYYLRGTLKGGFSSCSNPSGHDSYSRFDLAWPALQPYLGMGTSKSSVVEYYNADLDRYFMTSSKAEIAALDTEQVPGWSRTQEFFLAYATPASGLTETCRFFSSSFPKGFHFYTPYPTECAALKKNPSWQYEGVAFYSKLPSSTGTCQSGTIPLYHFYNSGKGGAPNHRYTTSPAVHSQMIAQGWTPEGLGTLGVIACVPG